MRTEGNQPIAPARGDRGAVMVFAILIIVVLMLTAGLVVDLGQQRAAARTAQANADVIALDMARLADGREISDIAGTQHRDIRKELVASASRNGLHEASISGAKNSPDPDYSNNPGEVFLLADGEIAFRVQFGWFTDKSEDALMEVPAGSGNLYDPDQPLRPANPAERCGPLERLRGGDDAPFFGRCIHGHQVPNAAIVTAYDVVGFHLLPLGTFVGNEEPATRGPVRRTAIALLGDYDQTLAWTRLGSSLAAINPASDTLIGSLLNGVTNGELQVGSYAGLVNTSLSLDYLLEDLGIETGIPLTALSPDQLADTYVSLNDLMVATASALEREDDEGNAAALTLINQIIAAGVSNENINLADALGVQLGNEGAGSPAGGAFVDLPNLLVTSASLITGDHAVMIPGAAINIPGVAGVTVNLEVIEAPRLFGDQDGATGVTKQVRLGITPQLDLNTTQIAQRFCDLPLSTRNILAALLSGLISFLGCLLNPFQILNIGAAITGEIPMTLDVARVTGIQHIDCANQTLTVETIHEGVDLEAEVHLTVAAIFNGNHLEPPLLAIDIPAAGGQPLSVTLNDGDHSFTTFNAVGGEEVPSGFRYTLFDPPSAQVGTSPLGLGGAIQIPPANIQVIGTPLGVVTNMIIGLIQPALNAVLAELDQYLVQPLTEMLGLHAGAAHIWPQSMTCVEDTAGVRLVG